jgi:hypothetical protein
MREMPIDDVQKLFVIKGVEMFEKWMSTPIRHNRVGLRVYEDAEMLKKYIDLEISTN